VLNQRSQQNLNTPIQQAPRAPQRPTQQDPISQRTLDTPAQRAPSAPQRPTPHELVMPTPRVTPSQSANMTPRQTQPGIGVPTSQATDRLASIQDAKLNQVRTSYKAIATIYETLIWRIQNNGRNLSVEDAEGVQRTVNEKDHRIFNDLKNIGDPTSQIIREYESIIQSLQAKIPTLTAQVQSVVRLNQTLNTPIQQASRAPQRPTQHELVMPTHRVTPSQPAASTERRTPPPAPTEQSTAFRDVSVDGKSVKVQIDDDQQMNADLPPFRRGTIPQIPSSETASSFNFRRPLFPASPAPATPSTPTSPTQSAVQELIDAKDALSKVYERLINGTPPRSHQRRIIHNSKLNVEHHLDAAIKALSALRG